MNNTTSITITIPGKKGILYYYKISFNRADFDAVIAKTATLKAWKEVYEVEKTGLWTVLPQ